MNPISNDTERAGMQSHAHHEHLARNAEHQRARRAAKRGFLWLALVYLGFLGGGVSIAVGQIVRPFGL